MKCRKKRTESSTSSKYKHIPKAAMLIDTAIAIVLFGIGIYHFTQPNDAWRSGTTEFFCSMLLLTAAYLVSRTKAVVMNLIVAGFACILGSYHLTHGGWRSGITELLFAVVLVIAVIIICRAKES